MYVCVFVCVLQVDKISTEFHYIQIKDLSLLLLLLLLPSREECGNIEIPHRSCCQIFKNQNTIIHSYYIHIEHLHQCGHLKMYHQWLYNRFIKYKCRPHKQFLEFECFHR